jgi:hypothetical protein
MKLDKDTVVKHQFWFLLGTFLLVWIIAVFWLKVAAGGPIEAAQKKYKGATDTLNTAKRDPINVSKVLPPWEKQTGIFEGWKGDIWKKAWNLQGGMYDWPEYLAKTKDMTTPQTELTDDERSTYQHRLYKAEIDQLREYVYGSRGLLKPIELQGGFDRIFQPMEWKEIPTREEMWLVQEDYWVKRELFYVLWKVMAEQAFMAATPIDEKNEPLPKDVKARYRYRNQNWELTLNIRENKEGALVIGGDSTIKNVHPSLRTQSLTSAKGEGIVFNLSQNANRLPTPFRINGEPLPPGEARPLSMEKDKKREDYSVLDGIEWPTETSKKPPVYVSQAFDVSNCPIRRVNQIALAKQDCRTYAWALQANQALAQLDAPPEDPNAKKPEAAPTSGGMMGGGAMGGGAMGGGAMMGSAPGGSALGVPPGGSGKGMGMVGMTPNGPGVPGGAANAENRTPNNEIERNRYLRPTNQDKSANPPSRHLPFALQLVVEQSHMHDVLVAMANSRLRIQITQVEFRHVKDFVPQSEGDKKGASPGGGGIFMAPGMPNMADMYGGSPRPGMGGSGSMPGGSGPMSGGSAGMGSMAGSGSMKPPGQMLGGPPPMLGPPPGAGSGMPGMPAIAGLPSMQGRDRVSPIGPNADPKQPVAKSPDDNLVEMTIYGVAALYRRPDPPKTTEQSTPTGPQQPGGVQPPVVTPPTPDKPSTPAEKPPEPKPAESKQPEPKTAAPTPKDEKR